MLQIRTSAIPNTLYDSDLKKRRIIGLVLVATLLALFLVFNRVPKLDTVQADLTVATSGVTECFQGFCIEGPPESSLLSRWWEFSLTYLRLVSVGMTFAFLVAGATEVFLFPKSGGWNTPSPGIRGSLKGGIIGPVMNLCSACIVPVASAFRRRGSSVETTLAITQASSTLNIPALIMAAMVFTPLIGGARIGLSIVSVLLVGPLVVRIVRGADHAIVVPPTNMESPGQDLSGWGETLLTGLREWVKTVTGYVIRLAPVMVLAGLASGLAIQWLSPQAVTTWLGDDLLGIVIAASLGIAINVPLLFEIPLVAALLLAGMGSAPAAALLFTAAAGGPITFWGLSKVMPKRAVAGYGTATLVLGIVGGLVVLGLVSLNEGPDLHLRADYIENRPEAAARAASDAAAWVSAIQFTDVTREAGITHTHTVPVPLNGALQPRDMIGGAVAEDFDGDGWIDLFVLRGGTSPTLLYMNRRDGTFVDEAAHRGADLSTNMGAAAAAADFDNDGDVDIVAVSLTSPHHLLINDGNGRFTVDTAMLTDPEQFATSPSWGDVDNDGLLELAIGEWNSATAQNYQTATSASGDWPPPSSPNPVVGGARPAPLFLYRNLGQGRLEPYEFRVTPAIDLWVFAPRFADMNGDGLSDLAVVSDYGGSRIYTNVGGGKFELDPDATEVLTDENGMGSAIGDYDNDGDLDWFVSSIFGRDDPSQGVFGGTGNRLYRNEGEMLFVDTTTGAGVRDGGWGWGASFGDLDNDGDLDLYHVNGWTRDRGEGDLSEFDGQPARLFENLDNGRFIEVAEQVGAGDRGQGRGVILFDFDNDGDLDAFITNNHSHSSEAAAQSRRPAAPTLLRNDTTNGNNWLKVTLQGDAPLHRDGIGSTVYVTVNGITQMRQLHASTNYVTQEPGRIAHFGLADATTVDQVRVEWTNGETEILTNIPANQHITISSR